MPSKTSSIKAERKTTVSSKQSSPVVKKENSTKSRVVPPSKRKGSRKPDVKPHIKESLSVPKTISKTTTRTSNIIPLSQIARSFKLKGKDHKISRAAKEAFGKLMLEFIRSLTYTSIVCLVASERKILSRSDVNYGLSMSGPVLKFGE